MTARMREQAVKSLCGKGHHYDLNDLEQIAIEALMSQEAHLQRDLATAMELVTQRYLVVFAAIEERIGLEKDALQTTHTIDAQTMTVRERAIAPLHVVDDPDALSSVEVAD